MNIDKLSDEQVTFLTFILSNVIKIKIGPFILDFCSCH